MQCAKARLSEKSKRHTITWLPKSGDYPSTRPTRFTLSPCPRTTRCIFAGEFICQRTIKPNGEAAADTAEADRRARETSSPKSGYATIEACGQILQTTEKTERRNAIADPSSMSCGNSNSPAADRNAGPRLRQTGEFVWFYSPGGWPMARSRSSWAEL